MKYITADYIFPITSEPLKNGYVLIDDDGTIISISANELQTSNPKP